MIQRAAPDMLLRLAPDLVASPMDGEIVAMSVDRGAYYGIGGVGPRIFELLQQPVSFSSIVDTICSEYEVDRTECEASLRPFVDELLQHGVAVPA